MGYDHDRIKSNARLFYKNNTGSSILTGIFRIVAALIICVAWLLVLAAVNFIISRIVPPGISKISADVIINVFIILYILVEAVTWILAMCAVMLVNMGIMNWFRLSIFGKVSTNSIFITFKKDRIIGNCGTCLLMSLYIILWSLLLYIPGVIKSYSYSQTLYIRAENPNISPSRAIELSKIIMDGHKGQLFYLHLSFIGWFILSALTSNILGIVYVI
ncbi:MAG: DUF975 family protein, partial [Oscillospiraceae bacterium]|nr:DUF975 family protein [Oscillospiraceae bacterium]